MSYQLSNKQREQQRKQFSTFLCEPLRRILPDSAPFPYRIKTVTGSMKALIVWELYQKFASDAFLFVLVPDEYLLNWQQDLEFLAEFFHYHFLRYEPEAERLAYTLENANRVFLGLSSTLSWCLQNPEKPTVILASPSALSYRIPPASQLREHLLRIETGQTLAFEEFVGILALQGYNRKEIVELPGEFAIRGGIVDLFPPDHQNPVRIEFFGDQVESIRYFDPGSQRSIQPIREITFLSALHTELEFTTFLDEYLPEKTLFVIDTPALLQNASSEDAQQHLARLREKLQQYIELNPLHSADLQLTCTPLPSIHSSIQTLWQHLGQWQSDGYTVVFTADTPAALRRLQDLLDEFAYGGEEQAEFHTLFPNTTFLPTPITEGFICEDLRLVVLPERHIFQRAPAQRRKHRGSLALLDLQALKKGDYVVHEDKGIAIFDGLESIEIRGQKQECVRLIFAGNDVVYLNINYLHKLQKYSAQSGVPPKLTRLGTREWERKKAKVKKKLQDIAEDLIKLYAKRKILPGYAYPEDTLWQKEMEASFQFEDTPDQAKATEEVKADMEAPTPMDRLICGDVGFGKTEIAIRAAFKAVQAGKQVALLVPTTILALQHYETFRDRLRSYPVEIALLSRLQAKAEQRTILEKLRTGAIDIIIGTHRLLSKDVQFRDLGLLIIDEEHRFGVAAKEKIRTYKVSVDTLTLTATPIPRTLHMALMGAKDISIITTPPKNRLPIHTQIIQWDPITIREAIHRELSRGGQIFFVNDRIGNLEEIANQLREIVPDLRIGIVHGQMPAKKIENTMHRFLTRKLDLLLATKIIESGIDIPNANTIFINRADKFGLAELYQLRGRVGRSSEQAFCYLITLPFHHLPRQAVRRLQALEEFTALGSGLNLALRDLEIRGAGNVFGAEQSGYIADIGFEMYQKILEEAIQELRYTKLKDLYRYSAQEIFDMISSRNELSIESSLNAGFPESYIPSELDRFWYYKQLYRTTSEEELRQLEEEIRDRFGKLPQETQTLFQLLRLRITALPLGFSTLTLNRNAAIAEFPQHSEHPFYTFLLEPLLHLIQHSKNYRLQRKGESVSLLISYDSIAHLIEQLQQLREALEKQLQSTEQEHTAVPTS